MKRYIIRALKSSLYLCIILLIFLAIIYLMSKDVLSENASVSRIFTDGSFLKMVIVLVIFGAMYPTIGFSSVKVPLNKPLTNENKAKFAEHISIYKYELEKDENNILYFRLTSKLNRLTRIYEDTITVNYATSVLEIKGLRRDIYRFKRYVENFNMLGEEEKAV